MKKTCKKIVVVCLLLMGILNNSFYTYASNHKETTEPGNLYALSAVLMDGTSGRVLYGKNAEEPRAMASTTKIMTCILILEHEETTRWCRKMLRDRENPFPCYGYAQYKNTETDDR